MRARTINESKKLFERKWDVKLHLGSVWSEAEELDTEDPDGFDQFKILVMPKLRNFLDKMTTFLEDEDEVMKLESIIQALDYTEDVMEWDYSWGDFYDWADDNKVWIDTMDGNAIEDEDEEDQELDDENY